MGANGVGNVVGLGPSCVSICDAGSNAGAEAGVSVAPTTGGDTEMTGSSCKIGRAAETKHWSTRARVNVRCVYRVTRLGCGCGVVRVQATTFEATCEAHVCC